MKSHVLLFPRSDWWSKALHMAASRQWGERSLDHPPGTRPDPDRTKAFENQREQPSSRDVYAMSLITLTQAN